MRATVLLGIALAIASSATAFGADPGAVKVWEEKVVIPTYLAGDPEPNPMFFFGRESQGSQGPVYPYPMYDSLTGKKVDKTYTAVYLENAYVRIGVLPEIGGRIFEGVDKTNGYNFIYRQHVIKPALIGLLGAWISGGVEWNVPFHHRATTFLPVQYRTEENADGGKTIWVGELEPRQRMRWAVGYTLRPGKAYLEAQVRILNRTPEVETMLCFANLAIQASQEYQVLFPPSTQFGVYHAKREFTEWPISHSVYNNADFTKGVDVSWYKNHTLANSIFAWNYQDDFFGGYDHGKEAGTMTVADHNIVPGKKFWTWGNGASGRRWDKTLTDDDGPYMELMAGAYSDNQPDYSWMEPYEARSFSINWYPFRDIGGVKNANLDAAVNLELNAGVAKVGFYATSAHSAATVRLVAGGKVLLEEKVAIDPGRPYVRQVKLPADMQEHDLVASLWDGDKELVEYTPVKLTQQPTPPVVTPPAAPKDAKTNDELYLIGLRAWQFHDPAIDPIPYWQEALRRDPGDTRVNTVLGIVALGKARYSEADAYLSKALERATDRYTDPKDAEPLYYLGVTMKAEGKVDEAYTAFYKATWSSGWKSAAYYSLAQIAAARGQMEQALDFAQHSVDANAGNIRAQNLKAAALRHLGRLQESATVLASASHAADPLDVRAESEMYLESRDVQAGQRLAAELNHFPVNAQETAAEYMDEGLWQDGIDVLQLVISREEAASPHPMVLYYLGYFEEQLGHAEQAVEFYRRAAVTSPEYVFPFQSEEIDVLQAALKANPQDARAAYYLGNLLYDWQPEKAMAMWSRSAQLEPGFAIVHRNLAVGYMHQASGSDLNKAIVEMEKAVSRDKKYALHFTELDELYEQAGVPLEKRLKLFEQNEAVVAQRDDAINREIALQIATGQVDQAIQRMTQHTFAVAEGENLNVVEHWTDAHLLRARTEIAGRRYADAIADLKAANEVPENLPISVGFGGTNMRYPEIDYWLGVAYRDSGDSQKGMECWRNAVAPPEPLPGAAAVRQRSEAATVQSYYRALAFQALGKDASARDLFSALVQSGQRELQPASQARRPRDGQVGEEDPPRVREANGHYLAALGYLGLNQQAHAKSELSQATAISPDLLGARTELAWLR
jgi:tetratricopeptide (TPR) repeat protein